MIKQLKNLGTPVSREKMKEIKGGYVPCEPPVCTDGPCPNCKYHCELYGPPYGYPYTPFSSRCVSNIAV